MRPTKTRKIPTDARHYQVKYSSLFTKYLREPKIPQGFLAGINGPPGKASKEKAIKHIFGDENNYHLIKSLVKGISDNSYQSQARYALFCYSTGLIRLLRSYQSLTKSLSHATEVTISKIDLLASTVMTTRVLQHPTSSISTAQLYQSTRSLETLRRVMRRTLSKNLRCQTALRSQFITKSNLLIWLKNVQLVRLL